MDTKEIISKSRPIFRRNDVIKAGIFGSFVRGEAKKKSDIDFLVQFKGRKSLFDLVELREELKNIFRKDVDVITYSSIHPLLKDKILSDEVKII